MEKEKPCSPGADTEPRGRESRNGSSWWELEEVRKWILPWSHQRKPAVLTTLSFGSQALGLLASRTVREEASVAVGHPVSGSVGLQP